MAGRKARGRPAGAAAREILYGFHAVAEALAAGRRTVEALMVDRVPPSDRQARIIGLAESRGIPWQAQTPDQLRAAAGSDQHQGVAARVSPLPVDRLEAVMADITAAGRDGLLVMLDGIVDPVNLGAIVRTAHCAGADAVVIPKDRAVGATPAVSKVSAGALEHVRVCRVTNLAATITWLKQRGVWVAGLAMEAERTVFQADLKGPLALVVGGEEKGLRRWVKASCDFLVAIPLYGRVDSLNASAASAVVLYEAVRQRRSPV